MSSQSVTAYSRIKDMILHMEIMPGARIPELQIASILGISRTPIHDALRSLEAEGLVNVGPNRGATVANYSEEEIREIGTIRLIQDMLASQLAAYYGSAADFTRLDAMVELCEKAAASGDIYQRIKTDTDFHLSIAEISGNAYLLKAQQRIYQQIHLVQISKYTDVKQSLFQIHHHGPIVNAIRNSDMDAIQNLTCEHIRDFYKIDPYIIKNYRGTTAEE